MAKYEVLASILDRIDPAAGLYDDGRPKKVVEHKRGDTVEFDGTDQDRIDELVRRKAIKPAGDKQDQKGGPTAPQPATGGAPGAPKAPDGQAPS